MVVSLSAAARSCPLSDLAISSPDPLLNVLSLISGSTSPMENSWRLQYSSAWLSEASRQSFDTISDFSSRDLRLGRRTARPATTDRSRLGRLLRRRTTAVTSLGSTAPPRQDADRELSANDPEVTSGLELSADDLEPSCDLKASSDNREPSCDLELTTDDPETTDDLEFSSDDLEPS